MPDVSPRHDRAEPEKANGGFEMVPKDQMADADAGAAPIAAEYPYRAFISYNHRDAKSATWLHRALEVYRVPKRLVGRKTATGIIGPRVGTIFRDRDELPVSSDLSGKINDALAASQFLIVLCSRDSAKSKWVNQEVLNFKRLRGMDSIIAVIIDGEPGASAILGRESEECFVPSLRFRLDTDGQLSDQPAEPIAADLRAGKDRRRLVRMKVLAGILGVGLDELIRRDNQRRQKIMAYALAASAVGVVVMAALTWNAVVARNDANRQRAQAEIARDDAQRQRAQAEDLVEFMLGDLRKKLQPVGRLDILDDVGQKVLSRFKNLRDNEIDQDTLGRRSRALHLIGEISDGRGDLVKALEDFSEAANITQQLLDQDRHNPQRIFEHAQSVYWLGYIQYRRGLT